MATQSSIGRGMAMPVRDPLLLVRPSNCQAARLTSRTSSLDQWGNRQSASFHVLNLSAWQFGLLLCREVHDLRHCHADNRLSVHSRLPSHENQQVKPVIRRRCDCDRARRHMFPAGFQQGVAADQSGKPLVIGIWYPSQTIAKPVSMGPTTMTVAINAPVNGKSLPMIVMSHGTGGSYLGHSTRPLPWLTLASSWWP
jgi:hypothetical protein